MNESLNKLVVSLFGKNTLDECSLEEIRSLNERYPYFAIPYLFLAEKHEDIRYTGRREQLKRSTLYFNNPLWLSCLLKREKNGVSNIHPAPVDENEPNPFPREEDPFNDEIVYPNPRIEAALDNGGKEKGDFIFEPYHTVDYFASQGIRNTPDEKPQDRFGKQLKSFTDWLRAMKKLPESEIVKNLSPASEASVVKLAEHSIEDRNVVTETMAELWIRQQRPEKAIEIYNKLSLLNPSKSGYFAGLIEKLKQTS